MRQEDAQFRLMPLDMRVVIALRISQVILVVHAEAGGDSPLVLALAIHEGGVWREDREASLQFRLLVVVAAR